jgi:class 3 adenylate cyclase
MPSVEAPPLERKLVAILAADVVEYSRLMHENEEHALATLSSHRASIDALIASARGEIAGTAGDSVLAEFNSVVDAVNCAIAIQQTLAKANAALPADRRMELRIGINVGDVMVKDGTIFGDGVNVAARLETLAEAGQICVTRGVRDHLRDRGGFEFEDLGEHSVKNIARPVRVFRVLFDPKATADLQAAVQDEGAKAPEHEHTEALAADATEIAFWQSVEAANDPAEYRAYLEKFPAGAFAALAAERIENPPKPSHDRLAEIEFWSSIKDSDQPEMFEAYLTKYADGEFRDLAELRLQALGAGKSRAGGGASKPRNPAPPRAG